MPYRVRHQAHLQPRPLRRPEAAPAL